jgi:hypothetical protein
MRSHAVRVLQRAANASSNNRSKSNLSENKGLAWIAWPPCLKLTDFLCVQSSVSFSSTRASHLLDDCFFVWVRIQNMHRTAPSLVTDAPIPVHGQAEFDMGVCCMYSTCNSHASGPGQTLEKAGKLRCWQQVQYGSLSSTRVQLLNLIQTLRYALLFLYFCLSLSLCNYQPLDSSPGARLMPCLGGQLFQYLMG